MFLRLKRSSFFFSCLLHACGDVSGAVRKISSRPWFAPRMWRCFSSAASSFVYVVVCSTHVEMFLDLFNSYRHFAGLLHACGDVSFTFHPFHLSKKFAPRMWRCFRHPMSRFPFHPVCSTHVEMFPICIDESLTRRSLLHACGDVSTEILLGNWDKEFAPRMWRCFHLDELGIEFHPVCSTHVEMFLMMSRSFRACVSLLHACGDVSCKDHLD